VARGRPPRATSDVNIYVAQILNPFFV